ncbi:MAG: hypothetical protein ABL958_16310 [Bdellovibrionia bacterium]
MNKASRLAWTNIKSTIGCFVCTLLLSLPTYAQFSTLTPTENALKTSTYFFRLGSAQENGGKTYVLLGRIEKNRLQILSKDLHDINIQLGASDEIDVAKPAAPDEQQRSSLQFKFNKEEVKECTSLREFQTFLNQIPHFKGMAGQFDVTASGTEQRACALAVASEIEKRGIRTKVFIGKLPEGGVSVRTYLGGAESDNGQELILTQGDGTSSQLQISADGVFVRTWSQPLSKPLRLSYSGPNGKIDFEVKQLPALNFGDQEIFFSDASVVQVYASKWDQAERIKTPEDLVTRILEKEREIEKQNRLQLSLYASLSRYQGSGVNDSPTGIVPTSLGARYRLTPEFYATADLTAPLKVGDQIPELINFVFDFDYWLIGEEIRADQTEIKNQFRLSAGLGMFFYHAKPPAAAQSRLSLSDLLGGFGSLRATIHHRRDIMSWAEFVLSPMPPTQSNEFSVSYRASLGVDYCWAHPHCAFAGYRSEYYSIKLPGVGNYDSQISSALIGYRRYIK